MNIWDYQHYNVLDFFEDSDFKKWVLQKDSSQDFFWEAYFKEFPDKRHFAQEAKEMLSDLHDHYDSGVKDVSDFDPAFGKKLQQVMEEEFAISKPIKKSNHFARRIFITTASVAAVLFFLFFGYNNFFPNTSTSNKYVTGNAEWKSIELPDGSKVELNANSQLSLMGDWTEEGDRTVWLKGEAFFKVEKKLTTNAKFLVVTKDLTVQVLGTSFSVNTRNQQTEVFLEEGKINLELPDKKEAIVPGEVFTYSLQKKKVVANYKKTEDIHANWKNGVLKIDATIEEIIAQIETVYGVDIITNDLELLKQEKRISFPVDNLELATAIWERGLNVKIETKDNQLFINRVK